MTLAFKETDDLIVTPNNLNGTTYDKFGNIVGVDYSDTTMTIDVVNQTFYLRADNGLNRDYEAGDIILLTAKAGATGTMLAQVNLYAPSNQGVFCSVLSATGSGTGTAWRITKAQPRQDYHPATGKVRGARIEPAATNFEFFSHDASGDIVSGTITEGVITTVQNPEGNFSVRRVEVTQAGTYRYGDTTSGTANTQYVGSVFIMTEDGSKIVTTQMNDIGDQNFSVNNEQWSRVWATGSTNNNFRFLDLDLPVGIYYVFGSQIEEGDYPSSYIPTDDTQETRNVDDISVDQTLLATVLNSTEYSILCEMEHEVNTPDNTLKAVFSLSDGTSNNYVQVSLNTLTPNNNKASVDVFSGGASVYSTESSDGELLFQSSARAMLSFKDNEFLASVNNSNLASDNAGLIPTGLNTLTIGSRNGLDQWRGWVKRVVLFPKTFTQEELLEFTDNLGNPLLVP